MGTQILLTFLFTIFLSTLSSKFWEVSIFFDLPLYLLLLAGVSWYVSKYILELTDKTDFQKMSFFKESYSRDRIVVPSTKENVLSLTKKDETNTQNYCSQCGHELRRTDKYCTNCGIGVFNGKNKQTSRYTTNLSTKFHTFFSGIGKWVSFTLLIFATLIGGVIGREIPNLLFGNELVTFDQKGQEEFIKNCIAVSKNKKYCNCMLDKIQGSYTTNELKSIMKNMVTKNFADLPENYLESMIECKQ